MKPFVSCHDRKIKMNWWLSWVLWISVPLANASDVPTGTGSGRPSVPEKLAPYFHPPREFAEDMGNYRSPLRFYDGRPVNTPEEWKQRRQEILDTWHGLMGKWPPLIEKPAIEILGEETVEGIVRKKVTVEITPRDGTIPGYLLIPDVQPPWPAVIVVFYDPETGAGLGRERLDFGLQLAKRGFAALSVGMPASLYYPDKTKAELQPLSALAYAAANCYNALVTVPGVDPARVGITGHSYGGKWAMFAACLYDKFACAAWSDPGIVFDETRPNVNYWEPWYLGYEWGIERERGVPAHDNPRTGAYKKMIEDGFDLHELHALMAPRPFLVSGGSEDPPERWKALNHTVAVNRLLGYENRVAMTNRLSHAVTDESNDILFLFFEHFLKNAGRP